MTKFLLIVYVSCFNHTAMCAIQPAHLYETQKECLAAADAQPYFTVCMKVEIE